MFHARYGVLARLISLKIASELFESIYHRLDGVGYPSFLTNATNNANLLGRHLMSCDRVIQSFVRSLSCPCLCTFLLLLALCLIFIPNMSKSETHLNSNEDDDDPFQVDAMLFAHGLP